MYVNDKMKCFCYPKSKVLKPISFQSFLYLFTIQGAYHETTMSAGLAGMVSNDELVQAIGSMSQDAVGALDNNSILFMSIMTKF